MDDISEDLVISCAWNLFKTNMLRSPSDHEIELNNEHFDILQILHDVIKAEKSFYQLHIKLLNHQSGKNIYAPKLMNKFIGEYFEQLEKYRFCIKNIFVYSKNDLNDESDVDDDNIYMDTDCDTKELEQIYNLVFDAKIGQMEYDIKLLSFTFELLRLECIEKMIRRISVNQQNVFYKNKSVIEQIQNIWKSLSRTERNFNCLRQPTINMVNPDLNALNKWKETW